MNKTAIQIPKDLSYLDTTVVVDAYGHGIKMSCAHIIERTNKIVQARGVNDRLAPGTRIACRQCRDLTLLKERIAELEDHIGLHIEMGERKQSHGQ